MNKNIFIFHTFCVLLLQANILFAQNGSGKIAKPKIAIFAPLFLDSAFDNNNEYRFGKDFPKFINSGLEFIEGAQLALDSLSKEGLSFEVFFYDTRSSKSVAQILKSPEMEKVELIIAHTTAQELISFAEFAARKKVPVINANLPFDGGVVNNPYLVLLNSTLKTNCEAIYQHIQKYYATKRLIVFRQKGRMEDVVRDYLNDYTKITSGVPLKLKFVDLNPHFTEADLIPHLDSTKNSLCIAGSLDENFGKKLCKTLSLLNSKYPVAVMGMPTWDGITEFSSAEYRGLEIIYPTPFYNGRSNQISLSIIDFYTSKMYARPSDMVFRGYETTWRFAKLLNAYKKELPANISRKEFNVFRDFDIQPIFSNRQNMTLDYFENKKLFFIKKLDGIIKSVN